MSIHQIHQQMMIPQVYRGYTIKDFNEYNGRWTPDDVAKFHQLIIQSTHNRKNLGLCSTKTKHGKTMLAVAWLTELWITDTIHHTWKDEPERRFPSLYRFIDCTDQGEFEQGFEAAKHFKALTNSARGIVLDDLGREGKFASDWFMRIIYWCHKRGVPIMVTSNMLSAKLESHYGPNVIRRIDDNGLIVDMEVKG